MSHSRLNQIYMYSISAVGAAVLIFSLRAFPVTHVNLPFLILSLATVLVGPRLSIPIPRVRAHISVSDTFIFLALLLFGGEAAIVLATAEAICASIRISKKVRICVFNAGATLLADGTTLLLCRVEDRRGLSHLCAARSQNGVDGWKIDSEPTLMPSPNEYPEEIWGIEDPRITFVPELQQYAVTYTSYSRGGPGVSLALTKDFRSFAKRFGSLNSG